MPFVRSVTKFIAKSLSEIKGLNLRLVITHPKYGEKALFIFLFTEFLFPYLLSFQLIC